MIGDEGEPIINLLDDEVSSQRHAYWLYRLLHKYPVVAAIDWVAPEIKTNKHEL
jgi:hypothetical protein